MAERITNAEIREYIIRTFSPPRAVFRVATQSWTVDGQAMSSGKLSQLVSFAKGVSSQRTQSALVVMAHEKTQAAFHNITEWVKRTDSMQRCDLELRRFLRLMERDDTGPETHEANVVAMKQWMWQVKRGSAKLSRRWHVAPIFWSTENGTGKSYNVERLLRPVDDFARSVPVTELSERFSGEMYANTLVAYLDEFAGAGQACAATLKAILSGKPIDQRAMYSSSGIYSANHMSVIATSNEEPPHGFVDHTGARRFWSIHCDGASMESNERRKAHFDDLDIDAIWAAVATSDRCPHEAAPLPMQSFMGRIREERLRTKTSVEYFYDEMTEEADDKRLKTPLIEFQDACKKYCMDTKQPFIAGGRKKFAAMLKKLGCEVVDHSNKFYIRGRVLSSFDHQ